MSKKKACSFFILLPSLSVFWNYCKSYKLTKKNACFHRRSNLHIKMTYCSCQITSNTSYVMNKGKDTLFLKNGYEMHTIHTFFLYRLLKWFLVNIDYIQKNWHWTFYYTSARIDMIDTIFFYVFIQRSVLWRPLINGQSIGIDFKLVEKITPKWFLHYR